MAEVWEPEWKKVVVPWGPPEDPFEWHYYIHAKCISSIESMKNRMKRDIGYYQNSRIRYYHKFKSLFPSLFLSNREPRAWCRRCQKDAPIQLVWVMMWEKYER